MAYACEMGNRSRYVWNCKPCCVIRGQQRLRRKRGQARCSLRYRHVAVRIGSFQNVNAFLIRQPTIGKEQNGAEGKRCEDAIVHSADANVNSNFPVISGLRAKLFQLNVVHLSS